MHTEDVERSLAAALERAPEPIVAAYLFGSAARGTAGPASDIDVAVLYAADPPGTLEGRPFRLEAELERKLGRPVQVVLLNDAPLDLVHRVLLDGRLVLERNRSARIRFEVRARAEYFDLLPILRRYRRLDGSTE